MRETIFTELRNHAKTFFDAVEDARPSAYTATAGVEDIVPVKAAMPAWKKPPLTRLSLGSLSLSDEVLADRDESGGYLDIFFCLAISSSVSASNSSGEIRRSERDRSSRNL
jgi:hypothetical protein